MIKRLNKWGGPQAAHSDAEDEDSSSSSSSSSDSDSHSDSDSDSESSSSSASSSSSSEDSDSDSDSSTSNAKNSTSSFQQGKAIPTKRLASDNHINNNNNNNKRPHVSLSSTNTPSKSSQSSSLRTPSSSGQAVPTSSAGGKGATRDVNRSSGDEEAPKKKKKKLSKKKLFKHLQCDLCPEVTITSEKQREKHLTGTHHVRKLREKSGYDGDDPIAVAIRETKHITGSMSKLSKIKRDKAERYLARKIEKEILKRQMKQEKVMAARLKQKAENGKMPGTPNSVATPSGKQSAVGTPAASASNTPRKAPAVPASSSQMSVSNTPAKPSHTFVSTTEKSNIKPFTTPSSANIGAKATDAAQTASALPSKKDANTPHKSSSITAPSKDVAKPAESEKKLKKKEHKELSNSVEISEKQKTLKKKDHDKEKHKDTPKKAI